jgi:hypothetical protein
MLVIAFALLGLCSGGTTSTFTINQVWVNRGASNTGWYSSPAVGVVGGTTLIVAGQYDVTALFVNGSTAWTVKAPNGGRVWADIAIASVDGAGTDDDVVVAWAGGSVGVFSLATGAPLSTFNGGSILTISAATTNEFRALAVRDTDGDGRAEILVGLARGNNVNAWLINNDGTIRPGWPRPTTEEDGYSWGVYSNNVAITQLDADANLEVIVPSDVHYIDAYDNDGTPLAAGPGGWRAKSPSGAAPKWGHIPLMSDYALELDSSNNCGLSPVRQPTRTNMADAPIVVADFDNNGQSEMVVVGRSYEWCQGGAERSRHNGIYILNKDRTRWNATIGGVAADWREVPQPTNITGGKNPCCTGMYDALSMDYNVIQSANNAPVVGDLDGDK